MTTRHVIVDGSNLATEGRNMPSLEQLDRAVREFIAENPRDEVTVVVDASFGHRIDPSEVAAFEAAEEAGEVISPPAGAIGRGDAFLLRIAEKIGATVLSNDSFQEFHAEHSWLFEKGRLIGGKPVPGIGWIFMDRTPVRGAKSREVIKEAKRRKRVGDETEVRTPAGEKPVRARPKVVDRAIARATQEVVEPQNDSKGRRRRTAAPPSEPVNEPLAFITFIAAHPLGSEVVGTVAEYSSHGAFVDADGARCYIPLSAMGDPAPRKAREMVTKGEETGFVVQAFDPLRRGIELALPGFAHPAGTPTAETVEAEIHQAEQAVRTLSRRAGGRKRVAAEAVAEAAPGVGAEGAPTPVEAAPPTTTTRRAPTRRRPATAPEPAEVSEGGAPPVVPAGATPRRRGAAKAAAGAAPASPGAGRAVAAGGQAGVAEEAAGKAAPVKKRAPRRVAVAAATSEAETVGAPPVEKATRKRAAARKTAAGEAPLRITGAARPVSGEPAPAEAGSPSVKETAARKRAVGKAPAAKAVAAKAAAAKTTAGTRSPAGKAPAAKKAATAKAVAEKGTAVRKASPARAADGGAGGAEAPVRKAPVRRATKSTATAVDRQAATTAERPPGEAPTRKRAARKAVAEPAAPPATPAKVGARARKAAPPGN